MEYDKRGSVVTDTDKTLSGVNQLDTDYSTRVKTELYKDRVYDQSVRASASNPEGYSEWNNFSQTVTPKKLIILAILLTVLLSMPFIMPMIMGK